MTCEELMKKMVECIAPDDTVFHAAQRMRSEGIGFLPVCGESREILGAITDRDLALRIVAEGRPAMTPVHEVMSTEVVACNASDSVKRAEQLMSEHRKSRIMCTDDDGRLVGVISLSDMAQQDTGHATRVLRKVTSREARKELRPT